MAKKRGAGRPKTEINKEQFEKLCAICCTEIEIAEWFACSVDTVNNWCKKTYKMNFSEVYKIKSVAGKISLRRLQFKAAENGNTSMLIFLGKQILGQRDKVDVQSAEPHININVKGATAEDIKRMNEMN